MTFAVALILGVLARENLFALAPFLWLVELRRRGIVRATLLAGTVVLPAFVVFEAARLFPLFPPPPGFENWYERYRVDVNVRFVIDNVDGSLWRYLLAAPITLGVFVTVPLTALRGTVRFLRREPVWAYYIAATLGLSLAGGRDDGRYAYLLVPALAVVTISAIDRPRWSSMAMPAVLTAIQLALAFAFRPEGTTEPDYLEYTVAFMTQAHLRTAALVAAAGLVATIVAVQHDRRRVLSAAIGGRAARSA